MLAALGSAGADLVLIPEQARPRPYAMLDVYFIRPQPEKGNWMKGR